MNRPKGKSEIVNRKSEIIAPSPLKKGDKIAITCPAKKLPAPMTDAVRLLESWGLEVVLGETLNLSFHQFAGDDAQRFAELLQKHQLFARRAFPRSAVHLKRAGFQGDPMVFGRKQDREEQEKGQPGDHVCMLSRNE